MSLRPAELQSLLARNNCSAEAAADSHRPVATRAPLCCADASFHLYVTQARLFACLRHKYMA